mgnify:CR=1 FL=1
MLIFLPIHVINNLLDMTRTESGSVFSVSHHINISAVNGTSVDIHRPAAISTAITLESSRSLIGSVPSILFGDPVQVHPLLAVAHASTAFRAHADEPLML